MEPLQCQAVPVGRLRVDEVSTIAASRRPSTGGRRWRPTSGSWTAAACPRTSTITTKPGGVRTLPVPTPAAALELGRSRRPADRRLGLFETLDEVELFLNGRSLGRQAPPKDGHAESERSLRASASWSPTATRAASSF
ncbi:DUF4982 domain-containing protein [Caulobacter segnis]